MTFIFCNDSICKTKFCRNTVDYFLTCSWSRDPGSYRSHLWPPASCRWNIFPHRRWSAKHHETVLLNSQSCKQVIQRKVKLKWSHFLLNWKHLKVLQFSDLQVLPTNYRKLNVFNQTLMFISTAAVGSQIKPKQKLEDVWKSQMFLYNNKYSQLNKKQPKVKVSY